MLAALPLLASLAAASPVASPTVTPALALDAASLVGELLTSADDVVAVYELPGAVAFELIDDGRRWQLTVALDDDGLVVDSALGAWGPRDAAPPALAAQVRRVTLARVERIDRAPGGRVILRGGGRRRTLTIADAPGAAVAIR